MVWWLVLIIGILSLIVGIVIGFFLSKKIIQKQLQKNPLITEKQIRAMYMQMGRKPSEIDIKKVINSIKKVK